MASALELPSRKLLIHELQTAELRAKPASDTTSKLKEWTATYLNHHIAFSVVSIQGTVTETSADCDSIILDDGTGSARVKGCSKIPYAATGIKLGGYVMVVGQLVCNGQSPVVRAIKVSLLNRDPHADLWPLEVAEAALVCT